MAIAGFEAVIARLREQHGVEGYSGTWKDDAVRHGLVPVYSDWECAYALTPEGGLLYLEEAGWGAANPLTNLRHRFVAFAQAAEEYPEFAHLRPVRRPEDPECASCGGTGRVRLPDGVVLPNLMCECGGLGWYPDGTGLGPV